MDPIFVRSLMFGLLAAAANLIGGLLLFPPTLRRDYRHLLRYVLAIGAGFMLAVTLLEILPKTIELWRTTVEPASGEGLYIPMLLFMGGYLLTHFFEHTIAPHFHLGEELHFHDLLPSSSAYTAVAGFGIHTLFDGVSIAAASQIDANVGWLVFMAVFLHKIPEGFTIGSLVLAAGKGLRQVIIATALIGFTTIMGVCLFHLFGSRFDLTVAYALPLAAGITLYVAASDLIPEVNHHGGKSPLVSLSVFAGIGLFFATQQVLHVVIGH
jgi:zinc transporter ZupT